MALSNMEYPRSKSTLLIAVFIALQSRCVFAINSGEIRIFAQYNETVIPSVRTQLLSAAFLICGLEPTTLQVGDYETRWITPSGQQLTSSSNIVRYIVQEHQVSFIQGIFPGTILVILQLSYQDSGNYTCEARNVSDSNSEWVSATTMVTLLVSLQATEIQVNTFDNQTETSLSCEMRYFIRPDEDLVWFRPDNRRINSGSNRYTITYSNGVDDTAQNGGFTLIPSRISTLTISNPVETDSGNYMCRLLGTEESQSIELTVSDIVVGWESTTYTTNEGDGQVELCSVITSPPPGVAIEANDFFLAVNTQVGSADSPGDFDSLSMESIGPFGDASRRACVNVSVTDDDTPEPVEDFIAVLVPGDDPPPRLTVAPELTNVSIVDDDGIIVGWDFPNYDVTEGDGPAQLCAVVTSPSPGVDIDISDFFLSVSLEDGSADKIDPDDFVRLLGMRIGPFGNENRQACVDVGITDDGVPEYPEFFNARLTPLVGPGDPPPDLTIQPDLTTVNITDDDDIVVGWESTTYTTNEGDEQVELCAVITSPPSGVSIAVDDFFLAVNTQPGSAVSPDDYSALLMEQIGPFGDGSRCACVSVDIVNDITPETLEQFTGVLVPGDNPLPQLSINPEQTTVSIVDNDPLTTIRPPVNDTVIGDPLMTVPLFVTNTSAVPGIGDNDIINLCYEVHGAPDSIFNLVSDRCVTVNAHYNRVRPRENLNIIDTIYVRAVDNDGNCRNIQVDLDQCTASIDDNIIQNVNMSGIRVRKVRNRVRIAVPNCQDQSLVMWVFCQNRTFWSTVDVNPDGSEATFAEEMIRFVITRGFNLLETSHGILGQFWNIPVSLERFTEPFRDGTTVDNAYVAMINYPGQTPRRFVGWLHPFTWEIRREYCLYSGNGQGGPIDQVESPNDPVLEGTYKDYMLSGGFETEFVFDQFEQNRC